MKAIVTGASGQMGSYMVDFLSAKEYTVLQWHGCGTYGQMGISDILAEFGPDEIYNFAGKQYAPDSWKDPDGYMKANGLTPAHLLEAIHHVCPKAKFFQAGSAEVFEKASIMQAEDTNRLPDNPYGVAKLYSMESVRIYRTYYGLFACTGILFNAESPRRKKTFFAEKVAQEAVRLKREMDAAEKTGKEPQPIQLGRLDARRDWGWAPEYVQVAWKMLQQETPEDFVIGTGETHTCLEFVIEALKVAGLPDVEKRLNFYVKYDKVVDPVGNCMRAMPDKAKRILGWQAQYKFKDVVRMLVEAELDQGKALERRDSQELEAGLTPTIK